MLDQHEWLEIAPKLWRCRKCFSFAREDPTAGSGGECPGYREVRTKAAPLGHHEWVWEMDALVRHCLRCGLSVREGDLVTLCRNAKTLSITEVLGPCPEHEYAWVRAERQGRLLLEVEALLSRLPEWFRVFRAVTGPRELGPFTDQVAAMRVNLEHMLSMYSDLMQTALFGGDVNKSA